jgi:hypothetical protein
MKKIIFLLMLLLAKLSFINAQANFDTLLANKVYNEFCNELESSKIKINSSSDLLAIMPEIETKLFFETTTNKTFKSLITKMKTKNSTTNQNVEFAFKYILSKVIRECPTYAYGWGKRLEMKSSSILLGESNCQCIADKSTKKNSPNDFFKKIELLKPCTLESLKNQALVKKAQSEIDFNNPENMVSFGTNAFVYLNTHCDNMIKSYIDLTMSFAKKPIATWERDNFLKPLPSYSTPPPPPKN